MTILVTGGAGFIGGHLVRALVQAQLGPVVALDNFNPFYDPAIKRATAAELTQLPGVEIVEQDFGDVGAMRELFAAKGIRRVIHLGASPGVPYSVRHPFEVLQNNVQGTMSLLEAARAHPVERFLFASSSTVYGVGAKAPFAEEGPPGIPASPYGVSKRTGELLGLNYHRLHGLPFVGLRFFNVYGPKLRPELALAVFTRKILADEPLPLYGDGSVLRDFTHIRDICDGILRALTTPGLAGECLNLGHDQPVSISRLIALIEQAAGRKARIEYLPPRGEDLPLTHADLTKSRRLLGYDPQVPIEQGVEEYVAWARIV
jgi:UDP-glucuronate 4-epimerase